MSEEQLAAAGFIVQGVCAAGLYFARDVLTIALLSLLLGVGYGAYIPEFALMVRRYYGVSHYGAIFGTLLTSFGIGAFVGPVFEGSLVTATGGYALGFFLAAAVSVAVGLHLLRFSSGRSAGGSAPPGQQVTPAAPRPPTT